MAADVEDFDGLMYPELLWAIQGVQTWAIRMSQ